MSVIPLVVRKCGQFQAVRGRCGKATKKLPKLAFNSRYVALEWDKTFYCTNRFP